MAGENTGLDTDLTVEVENNDDTPIDDTLTEEVIDEEPTEGEEEETPEGEDEVVVENKSEDLPIFKDITKKFPTLFKEFPTLRHAFFHEKEIRNILPTVEDAKEAVEAKDTLEQFTSSITSGDVNDLEGTIKAFKEMGDTVVPNLAANFLPALRKSSPDDYYAAVTPVLVDICQSLYNNGKKNGNDNLMNAGLVAALHFFEDAKVASGETKLNTGPVTKKENPVDRERAEFRNERYATFYNDVVQDCDSQISTLIMSGLDPKNTMTQPMKEMLTEKVKNEVDRVLKSDRAYLSTLNSHWKKAGDSNFSTSHKPKIVNTYLGRAKEIMPGIRSKIRASALGLRTRAPENGSSNGGTRRVEPRNTVGGGSQGRQVNSNLKNIGEKASDIDWSKTSDLDVIRGKITYKSNGK